MSTFVSRFTPEEIAERNRRVFGDPNETYTYQPVVARAARPVREHDLNGYYGFTDA